MILLKYLNYAIFAHGIYIFVTINCPIQCSQAIFIYKAVLHWGKEANTHAIAIVSCVH